MASARVRCASTPKEPSDIACVLKRRTMASLDSTSSSGTGDIGGSFQQIAQKNGTLVLGQLFKCRILFRVGARTCACRRRTISGELACNSAPLRKRKRPESARSSEAAKNRPYAFADNRSVDRRGSFGPENRRHPRRTRRRSLLRKAHDFKQMTVAIAGQRGDAHSRQYFAQSRVDRERRRAAPAAQLPALRQIVSAKLGHHRAGAARYQQGHVMRIENLRRFHNQRNIPPSQPNHRLPHRRRCQ